MSSLSKSKREELVYTICMGELNIPHLSCLIIAPSFKVRLEAFSIYQHIIDKYKYDDGWLSDSQCLNVLVNNKVCEPNIEATIKEVEERLDELKVQYYEQYFSTKEKEHTKKTISTIKNFLNELVNKRHSLDHLTLTGFAETIKQEYIIWATCLKTEDRVRMWPTINDVDPFIMNGVMSYIANNAISGDTIRELARTDPWKQMWSMNKNPFGINATEDQRGLVLFSKLYENIGQHPECPPDEIIEDDDALDGWLIKDRKKREKEKSEHILEDKFKHIKDAHEVFLPVKTNEDLAMINGLNDGQTKMIKRQREQAIKIKGEVTDDQFLDQKIAIAQQSNKQFIQTVKGK